MPAYVPPTQEEVVEAWRRGSLDQVVERGLAPLIGAPLRYMGRAADLVWVGFGPDTPCRDFRGRERILARYALHLQCPFRLDARNETLAAQQDLYHSATSPWNDPEDFDPYIVGGTWFESRVESLASPAGSARVVQSLRADPYGGFELDIEDLTLRVFPSTSFQREHWRFFQADGGDHLVVLEPPPV